MEFDGHARMPVSSIYNWHFLNKVFIDENLSMPADKDKYQKVGFLELLRAQQALALRSTFALRHIEKEGQPIANRLAMSKTRHKEVLKKLEDDHATEMDQMKEDMEQLNGEIKRLEPFESRARVLEEEVTKLMADIRASEHKVVDAQQKERDAKSI